jgi:hypothetical protein
MRVASGAGILPEANRTAGSAVTDPRSAPPRLAELAAYMRRGLFTSQLSTHDRGALLAFLKTL